MRLLRSEADNIGRDTSRPPMRGVIGKHEGKVEKEYFGSTESVTPHLAFLRCTDTAEMKKKITTVVGA